MSEDIPIYKPCGAGVTIRIDNGAYSFAKCTLLVCDGTPHEGEHRFAITVQQMLKKDHVTL